MKTLVVILLLITNPAFSASQLRVTGNQLVPQFISVNMNAANTDNQITHIPWAKYIVRRVIIYNCSTSLGATSTATLGVFTGAGGTGTTIVTVAVIVGLTATTKKVDLTVALTTDTLTAPSLFVRTGLAQGSAATCDVSIEAYPL